MDGAYKAPFAAAAAGNPDMLKNIVPYEVKDLSSDYPLPIVDNGFASRLSNSCHLFRFGPVVIVSIAFMLNVEIPAQTSIARFYSGYEAASGIHCASAIFGNTGSSCYALYREGEAMKTPLALPAGFYRGFIIYGVANSVWPLTVS